MSVSLPFLRRPSWAWPLLLALAFAASVALWLRHSDQQALEEERLTLIADALTLEARVSGWMDAEQASLQRLARQLQRPGFYFYLTGGLMVLGLLLGHRLSERAGLDQLAALATERLEL